jgi:3-dehydroquinate synthase
MVSGFAEMIKYGIIYDPKFFSDLTLNWREILNQDSKLLTKAVSKSLQWKAKAVSKDEFDRKGIREALNFGHTLGHALEAATDYKYFQHGEAILWGMKFATHLSMIKKRLSAKDEKKINNFLFALPVPAIPPTIRLQDLLPHLLKDKKVRNEKLHFVLLKKIGLAFSDSSVTVDEMEKAFQNMKENAAKEKSR